MLAHLFIFLLIISCSGSCSFKRVSKTKNIVYEPNHQLKLDVFSPLKSSVRGDVIIFIHGGNWRTGNKSIYRFVGKGFARKGITAVIINYRLSNKTTYPGMAADAAAAVKWTKENISKYKGDAGKIFLSGHSAGGNIAALLATDTRYFDSLKLNNPIKGVILIDAFGLDMNSYLKKQAGLFRDTIYYRAFTNDSLGWQDGSPAYHLREDMPRFLMLVSEKTYPFIMEDNLEFYYKLKEYQLNARLKLFKNRRHTRMITQFRNPHNKGYDLITEFLDEITKEN